MSVNLRILKAGLLLLVVIIACAADEAAVNEIREPRTFASRFGTNPKESEHDSNSKLTVVKYSSSKRGTRFKRNAVIDTAQIEAPADLEASPTFWPFTYLFGPDRRRVVVSRGGRPFGSYKRKEWWPSGPASRNRNRWW